MDNNESDAVVWPRPAHGDYTGEHGADGEDVADPVLDPAGDPDSEAEPIVVPVKDFVVIETDDAEAEPLAARVSGGGTMADTANWSEIKAMFVDDPAESVKLASGLVEQAISDLVTSLSECQSSLGSWQDANGASTEGLRNVLRDYRSLFEQLEGMASQFASSQTRASN